MSKILIRQLKASDAENLAKYGNNKKIWDNMRDYFPHPYSLEDGVSFVKMILENKPITTFAIDFEDELIGVIGYNLKTDIYQHAAEIGYWIGEPFWGKGFVTKALKQAVDHAFNEKDVKRLYTSVFEHNHGSKRVLEKAGFIFEGIGQKSVMKNNEYFDEYRYYLLNPRHFNPKS